MIIMVITGGRKMGTRKREGSKRGRKKRVSYEPCGVSVEETSVLCESSSLLVKE